MGREKAKRGVELVYALKEPETSVIENTSAAELEPVKVFPGAASRALEKRAALREWSNMLVSGDNLPVLKALLEMKKAGRLRNADGTRGVRLVYIDPPFSTNLKFKGKLDQKAYEDKLVGAEFLEFLRKRLILLRELMAEDGSIFVHLDWKKAHHVKVLMDEVFGEESFLNDIIWSYGGRGAKAISSKFSRNHDIILWYQRSSHIFNRVFVEKRLEKGSSGIRQDPDGRWFKTSPRGDYTDRSIEALEKEGRVYRTANGTVRIKYFLREENGAVIEDKLIGDVWDDIPDAMHMGFSEKTGYPTQKPEALLSRIIMAASNRGDLVLDAFAGAATTLAAAEKLGRRWVGIDSGRLAIHTAQTRLLALKGSRSVEGARKMHGKDPSAFTLYEVHPESCAHCVEPRVVSEYSHDEKTDEFVIRIKRFSGPGAGKGKPRDFEKLSAVMLDYAFDGEVFRLSELFTAEELKKRGYEIRFPVDKVTGEVMVIYSDISGNEKWFLGTVHAANG